MTTKPTARQVWQQLLDEAGEEQIQAVLSLTPEQVDAELAGFGVDVSKERAKADQFLEDLASGALEARMAEAPAQAARVSAAVVAAPQQAPTVLAERRRRPRTAMVLLIAATAAAAAGGAIYAAVHQGPSPTPPSPQPTPTPAPSTTEQPVVPDLVAAATWRAKAVAACKAEQWHDCLTDLDHARALDPDGDDTSEVKTTRKKAIDGILSLEKKNP